MYWNIFEKDQKNYIVTNCDGVMEFWDPLTGSLVYDIKGEYQNLIQFNLYDDSYIIALSGKVLNILQPFDQDPIYKNQCEEDWLNLAAYVNETNYFSFCNFWRKGTCYGLSQEMMKMLS